MKKLCLILTLLYAFGANCSAESSLNIAKNLLEGDNSKFESSMGAWTSSGTCLIANESGRNGNYLKLTDTGASHDYDKQMEYSLSGHTPAEGKKYVIKFWAKKVSGSGQIKVLLQKNSPSESYPQIPFGGNEPISIADTWTHYEYELTANKGDYEVIKINFGNCGQVWIDDIEYGEYSASAPGVTLNKASASVKPGGTITLTATVTPADAANKNVTWSSSAPSVATVSNGVVTGVATGTALITATTVDGNYTASCTVTVKTSLPPVMLYDFNDATDVSSIANPSHSYTGQEDRKEHLYIDIIEDPYRDGKCLSVTDGNYKDTETCIIDFGPSGVNFDGYGILAFDINFQKGVNDATTGQHEDFNYKDVLITLECEKTDGTTEDVPLQKFHTQVFPAPVWDTKLIPLTKTENGKTVSVIPDGTTHVKLKIGPLKSMRCIYLIDNIRIKENVDEEEDYKQDGDFSDIWWKYADETLYIKGTGPIPAYKDNKKCPWESLTDVIRYVDVSEGITAVGDYSIGNSKKEVVDITLHSIPEYFGEHCLERQYESKKTRNLHLVLRDEEKPFIAKSKSTYFPTFKTAKYYRDVTSNYSTVCLPFPVAEDIVTDAGVELFDFTSIKKNGEQYTLAFTTHSGGMAAGQTYLIKKHDREVTLENTNVGKDQFILTPKESTITGSNPAFSISMKGVFQPSVFGPNLGTEQDPVYTYGFKNEKFYMNSGNMSVRPMRGYFYGSQLYSGQQQSGAKKMPKMFNFEIVPDNVTHISSPAFIAEDFNIEEVYSPSGMKTNSLNKGLNIIRTSTGRVLKVMVK